MSHSDLAIPGGDDLRLVLLSFLIATVTAHLLIVLARQIVTAKPSNRISWQFGGAISMGVGIWLLYGAGRFLFRLPLPTMYDLPTGLISLLISVVAAGISLLLVSRFVLNYYQLSVSRVEKKIDTAAQTQQLEVALERLKQTQLQLIQAEKMSSLGQLAAGLAHEINNSLNFIYGNLIHSTEYIQDLLDLLRRYQQCFPNPGTDIEAQMEAIELDVLVEDLPQMLSSMKLGTDRICETVFSMQNFCRMDDAKMHSVDLHQGLDNTLLILHNRLKAQADRSEIQIIKDYGKIPSVECYANQINQVFMNILANAIDALEEGCRSGGRRESRGIPTIRICTKIVDEQAIISITDNGSGMTQEVRDRIFESFFTTKPMGKGTGLGLLISYQIVVEKHGGQLQCTSSPGKGTEFLIKLALRRSPQKPPQRLVALV
ncbi:MAG: GHKL domain-containing protein [Kastovskya adunca ATA6-11-RM4]|jgi:hypothetical protein|nr:GHKL domain-containing protein [Kastovskya adunca ATA6-11-RM4]